jgi:hypothetical protein
MQRKTSRICIANALVFAALAGSMLTLVSCRRSEDATSKDASSIVGVRIQFGQAGGSGPYRSMGWSNTEEKFTWTEGNLARLSLPIGSRKGALNLRMMISALTNPPDLLFQPVEVLANEKQVAQWQVSSAGEFTAIIPAEAMSAGSTLEIEFRTPKAVSPKALGLSEDPRILGICVQWLELAEPQRPSS